MNDTFTGMTIICQNSIFTEFCTWYREVSQCARVEPGPAHLAELGVTAQVPKLQDTLTEAHSKPAPQGAAEIQQRTNNESPFT